MDDLTLREIFDVDPFVERDHWSFEESIRHQVHLLRGKIPAYDKYLSNKGYRSTKCLETLPSIHVASFKIDSKLLSAETIVADGVLLESSGTSGRVSSVYLDSVTRKRQSLAMVSVMREVLGEAKNKMLVVDHVPQRTQGNSRSARYAAIAGYLKFSKGYEFLFDLEDVEAEKLSSRTQRLLEEATRSTEPVVVFGFTYMVLKQLVSKLEAEGRSLVLPTGSSLIHIGGWKALEAEKVERDEFDTRVADALGLDPARVVNIYGFTEQMGLNYPSCKNAWFHVPSFSMMRVIDPISHEPVEPGIEGLLEFTSPLSNSYCGVRVLTDDVGLANPKHFCGCGWQGQSFQVLGRRARAEIRGCGDVRALAPIGKTFTLRSVPSLIGVSIKSPAGFQATVDEKSPARAVEKLANEVTAVALGEFSVIEIISELQKLRRVWIERQDSLDYRGMWNHGLAFASNWIDAENLRSRVSRSIRGGIFALDGFVEWGERQSIAAVSRGLVAQWVSGNVPLLGLFPLVDAWLSKSPTLIRVSSGTQDALSSLLDPLRELGQSSEVADAMYHSLGIVTFDSADTGLHEAMSRSASTRIAWGGARSTEAVSALSKNPETRDVIFGPRTSVSVIQGSLLEKPGGYRKYARRLASDIFVFDQVACSSPHTVFVSTDSQAAVERFIRELDGQMNVAVGRFGAEAAEPSLKAEIAVQRKLGDLSDMVHGPNSLDYTIIERSSVDYFEPIYGRTISVVRINSMESIIPLLPERIQTVGLAATLDERIRFAQSALVAGVLRFPELGRATNFDSPWDGVFVFDSLVDYVTIGGP